VEGWFIDDRADPAPLAQREHPGTAATSDGEGLESWL
jgi:hypothetical protein